MYENILYRILAGLGVDWLRRLLVVTEFKRSRTLYFSLQLVAEFRVRPETICGWYLVNVNTVLSERLVSEYRRQLIEARSTSTGSFDPAI